MLSVENFWPSLPVLAARVFDDGIPNGTDVIISVLSISANSSFVGENISEFIKESMARAVDESNGDGGGDGVFWQGVASPTSALLVPLSMLYLFAS